MLVTFVWHIRFAPRVESLKVASHLTENKNEMFISPVGLAWLSVLTGILTVDFKASVP